MFVGVFLCFACVYHPRVSFDSSKNTRKLQTWFGKGNTWMCDPALLAGQIIESTKCWWC